MNETPEPIRKDVVIVGAGPAGLSALLWCSDLGIDAVLIEKSPDPGGQLLSIHNPIKNYLGREAGNGREMLEHFLAQSGKLLDPQFLGVEVTSIDADNRRLNLSDGRELSAKAIILATGVRRRRLGIGGEDEFYGRGVLESGVKEKEKVRGKLVVIVGGGDAALENALILSEFAAGVKVIHRSEQFRARHEFVDEVIRHPKIELITETEVKKIEGGGRVESLLVRNKVDGSKMNVAADAVLIRIGVEPNSRLVRGQVDLDREGYICVDTESRSSVSGVYCTGDVASPRSPTIATAAGMGATAAKSIFSLLKEKGQL